MGNILSFFFPQPAPASLEQVVVEVSEDVAKTMEATEEPVAVNIGVVDDYKPEHLVVGQKLEVVDEPVGGISTKQMDKQFEVIDEVSNVLKGASIMDSDIEAQDTPTLEPSLIVADFSVVQEKETVLTEVETISSIQDTDSDVELVEETISEPMVEAPSEPTKCLTPEPQIANSTEDKPNAGPAPTPEPVKAPIPDPLKAPTPEPESTPEPISTPQPISTLEPISTPESMSTPEPIQSSPEPAEMPTLEPIIVTTPEAINSSVPEPIQSHISLDDRLTSGDFVEVKYDSDKENIMTELETIGSIQDIEVDLVEEIISELIVETPHSNIEVPPKPTKSPTPGSERAYTPNEEAKPTCDPIPDQIKPYSPESMKADTPERTPDITIGAAGLRDVLEGSNDLNPAI